MCLSFFITSICLLGLSGSSASKESACNAGDAGSVSGSGRSPGGGHGNPLQHSYLGNPKDRGTWRAIVHGVTESGMTEVTEYIYMQSTSLHTADPRHCIAEANTTL